MNKHMLVRRVGITGLLVAAAATLLAACGSSGSDKTPAADAARTRTYIGTAQGTAALVAVTVDGTRALAYVCDGVPADPVGTQPTLQAWFNGPSDGHAVDVQQAGGRLRVQLTDSEMTGTLSLADGRTIAVAGRAVTGDAGLYRAEAADGSGKAVAGWILAANGEQRGGFGFDSGSGASKVSGTPRLILTQPTISLQGLATARIAKVGITPIPIP